MVRSNWAGSVLGVFCEAQPHPSYVMLRLSMAKRRSHLKNLVAIASILCVRAWLNMRVECRQKHWQATKHNMGLCVHVASLIAFFQFSAAARANELFFPRPQGTTPQKIIVIFEVVVFQFMTGSGPPPHFFCLRHCTRDCRERLLCPHTETLIKFASWSNNHFGSQLFTIKSWTPHLLAMKNRIKWDVTSPHGGGDVSSHFTFTPNC